MDRNCDTCGKPATHKVNRPMGDYVCGNPECRKLYLASGLHFVVLPPLCKDCGGSGYDPDWTKAGHEGMCHGCQGMGVEVEDDLL